jgi:hypothetical protein
MTDHTTSSGRAIDRHEDEIVHVLDRMDAGDSYDEALLLVSDESGLHTDRLHQLAKVWVAIAGLSDLYPQMGAR